MNKEKYYTGSVWAVLWKGEKWIAFVKEGRFFINDSADPTEVQLNEIQIIRQL